MPILELGPEFQAKLDWDLTEDRLHYLQTGTNVISGLSYRNKNDSENTEVINKIEEIFRTRHKKSRGRTRKSIQQLLKYETITYCMYIRK